MTASSRVLIPVFGVVLLTGCATAPLGPRVMVLPGYGKPFQVFQGEDQICRQWAGQQIGIEPATAANKTVATGSVLGTFLGGALGAAFGAAAGNPALGAAVGAGTGLLFGTASGASNASAVGWDAQNRFDIAYQQCMYAHGNQIPGQAAAPQRSYMPPPPPPPPPGPPPAGQLPPPPPAYAPLPPPPAPG